jgi:hypothetical protein
MEYSQSRLAGEVERYEVSWPVMAKNHKRTKLGGTWEDGLDVLTDAEAIQRTAGAAGWKLLSDILQC